MRTLPYVTEGYAVPEEQPVIPGEPAEYIGIYNLDKAPRIVVILKNHGFGRMESWFPVFECDVPVNTEPDTQERFFQILFTGIPSEKEDYQGPKW